jgi:dTDP-4-amino-4,6-dideoxygalactose transaminase
MTSQPTWTVPYVDLRKEFALHKEGYLRRLVDVGSDARYILRQEVEEFEGWAATFLGVKHAIGVASGSDALLLALHAMGIGRGDEVVTVAHTFVATIAAVDLVGATPVLVDVTDEFNMDPAALARAVTPRTKAVIPVHMNGRCCEMDPIRDLCESRGIAIIEDAAQSFGARYKGTRAGAFGKASAFSFHPMKVLHCFGDGGLLCTNDDDLAARFLLLRNHGQRTKTELVCFGYNSRLDNLQAAFLLENVKKLDADIARRREIAMAYHRAFSPLHGLRLPSPPDSRDFHDVYASYVVQTDRRDDLKAGLLSAGIEVFVHWDPPVHHHVPLGLRHFALPNNERLSRESLSLPIFPEMSESQLKHVIEHVRRFFA